MSINICTVTWLWLWGINIGYTGYSFWDRLRNFFTQIYINCFINCWTVAWHKGFFFYFLKFRNGKVTEMAKIGFFRFIHLAQFLSARQASISKNIKIISALNYKPRIMGLKMDEFPFIVHKLSVILTALQYKAQWKWGKKYTSCGW